VVWDGFLDQASTSSPGPSLNMAEHLEGGGGPPFRQSCCQPHNICRGMALGGVLGTFGSNVGTRFGYFL